MAAAAFAALVSLLNTIDQIQIHPFLSTCFNKYPIESLREMVHFLLDFVESHSDAAGAKALVRRCADVANEAENIIERLAASLLVHGFTEQSLTISRKLRKIIKLMDSIKVKVFKAKEDIGFITPSSSSSPSPSSSTPPTTAAKTTSTTMVGFDGYVEQLLDQLTGHQWGRQIIPIVGMGGIGKTTLARNVYESLHIVHHFDVRAWVTVSQEFNASEILSQALSCLGRSTSKTVPYDQLGEELSKTLYGRRYLVILDDVWSVEAWEKIMFFFPENNNGSRIIVTTRQQELVDYFSSSAVAVKFLDDKNSWQLFCEKTFAQEGCPHPELEQVGKKIVKKCKGLPLAIIMIGGLLGKSSRTQEYWEEIANDNSLIINSGEGNQVLSILSLSYKHLPMYLKPCFLYLGLFPEDYEFEVSKLTKLWVAEGFIKSNTDQSLEEVAECYIKELMGRNLVLVGWSRVNKKLKSCRVHDLVRDMCVRIAKKENIFCEERDVQLEGQKVKPFNSRLLRVMLSVDGYRRELNSTFLEVNLRFLLYKSRYRTELDPPDLLPSSISLLWSLQTLIITGYGCFRGVAPPEIWKMPQLRHIQMPSIYLPNPPHHDDVVVLQNLQTLKRAHNLNLSKQVCKRIPNIKQLHIDYDFDEQGEAEASSCYNLPNVGCLNKLESLCCMCWRLKNIGYSLQKLKLPSSLKELSLHNSEIEWSDMLPMIAALPHLEFLELVDRAVVGGEWCLVEEEFRCLKHLKIHGCDDLIKWDAGSSNFPVLETLDLEGLGKLEEIPSGIGDIPTLQEMHIRECSDSSTMSAVEILDEQESAGNEGIQLRLEFKTQITAEIWREKIKQSGFTSRNLHFRGIFASKFYRPLSSSIYSS